jgi:hypothetical protein
MIETPITGLVQAPIVGVVWPPIMRVIYYSSVHFKPSIIGIVVSRALVRIRVIYSAVHLRPFIAGMVETTPIIGMIHKPPIIRWISRYSSSIQLWSLLLIVGRV